MIDYGFYSQEELTKLDDSDLSFEIADVSILNSSDADDYLDLLISELQRRNSK
jgi:ferredoxin-fold anticodon binding domain-containing protein